MHHSLILLRGVHQEKLRKQKIMNFAQEIRSNALILRIRDLIGEDSGTQLVGAVNDAVGHKVLHVHH